MSVSSYQLSQQLRRQGVEAEERFIAATISAYEDAIDGLGDDIEALTTRIANLDEPSLSQIMALERFRSLQDQLTDEYERIVRDGTFPQIEALAADAIVIGSDGADAQMASYGIEQYASLGNAEMLALLDDVVSDGNLAKAIDAIPAGARDKVLNSLLSALAVGQGPTETARRLQDDLKDRSRRDIETLARTTQMGAQRKASIEHYARNEDVLDGWIWMASLGSSPTPCLACLAQHGTRHALDEPMTSHPRCRCVASPAVRNTRVEVMTGDAWFKSLSATDQQRILGPARYERWKAGRFEIADLISYSSGKYGESMSVTPAKYL